MGGDFFVYASCNGRFLNDLPKTKSCHAAASIGDKEEITTLFFQDERSCGFKIVVDFIFCLGTKRYQSFFTAFANHPNKTRPHVAAGKRQVDQL